MFKRSIFALNLDSAIQVIQTWLDESSHSFLLDIKAFPCVEGTGKCGVILETYWNDSPIENESSCRTLRSSTDIEAFCEHGRLWFVMGPNNPVIDNQLDRGIGGLFSPRDLVLLDSRALTSNISSYVDGLQKELNAFPGLMLDELKAYPALIPETKMFGILLTTRFSYATGVRCHVRLGTDWSTLNGANSRAIEQLPKQLPSTKNCIISILTDMPFLYYSMIDEAQNSSDLRCSYGDIDRYLGYCALACGISIS